MSIAPSARARPRRRRMLALAILPLLVMPTLASASAPAGPNAHIAVEPAVEPAVGPTADARLATDDAVAVAAAADPATTSLTTGAGKTKYDVRTKDAPFDGNDGRPHEGPFVEIDKSRKSDVGDVAQKTPKTPMYIDGKVVPESNDGVMDDKNRIAPKQGTTGTSGGVSEKNKQRKALEGQTGERVENTPETPKEVPVLPHHEKEKIFGADGGRDTKDDKAKDASSNSTPVLGKPVGLPDKTHDKTMPVPGSAKKDHLDLNKPDNTKPGPKADADEDTASLIQPQHSFFLSLAMILFSEIGDKTFLVAALMAMKHDRIVVFSAAFSALFAMTVLSAVLGHAVPSLIPKWLTNLLAAGLFLVFGARMLREGLAMNADEGVGAEMQEVEMELAEKEHLARENGRRHSRAGAGVLSPEALEMGMGANVTGRLSRSQSRFSTPNRSASSSLSPPATRMTWGGTENGLVARFRLFTSGFSNLASLLLSPAWVQTFVMTFLGEWGDRSQIATIAMAAGQDYWWVTLGAVIGHGFCTSVAVIGGRAIAGRVSLKVVTVGGAVSFLLFGIIYFIEAFYM